MREITAEAAKYAGIYNELIEIEKELLCTPDITDVDFDVSSYLETKHVICIPGYNIDVCRNDYWEARRNQRAAIIEIFKSHNLYRTVDTIEDMGRHWYMVFERKDKGEQKMTCRQIIDGGQYIPEQCVDCKLKEACRKGDTSLVYAFAEDVTPALISTPTADVGTVVWHEVKTRPLTEEEREYYSDDISYIVVCEMPCDGDEILIATKWGTDTDICCDDDYGLCLEKRGDWEDVLAWAYLPKYIAGEG